MLLDRIISTATLLMLITSPLTCASQYNNSSNEIVTNDYLQLSYNCLSPNRYIIRDNSRTEQLLLELNNCSYIPDGLFKYPNNIRKLILAAPTSVANSINNFAGRIFSGLESLQELELHGFEEIINVDEGVLRPLRNITSITLKSFGKYSYDLPFSSLGVLLRGLLDAPLQRIVMNGVRTMQHNDKRLNLADVFNIQNVKITSLIFENTYITALTGLFTDILPELTTLSLSLSITYEVGLYSTLDALYLPNLRSLNVHSTNEYGMTAFNFFEFSLLEFIIKVLKINFQDAYATFFDVHCNLNLKVKITESLTTLILNRIQTSNFIGNPFPHDDRPICIHESNQLRTLYLSGCQLDKDLPLVTGLSLLTFVNIQKTKISCFSRRQLEKLPKLESFLMGHNDLRDCIASDYDSTLFRSGQNLTSLDLAYCNLENIPYYEFNSLVSLKYLNLSGNAIFNVDFSLTNLTELLLLNLSNNGIEQLSSTFTQMLDQRLNATSLEIDLSGNPLSCFCNATDFLNWIQSPNHITFTKLGSYTCLYPNGTWVNLATVDIKQLKYQCRIIDELNNDTDCPCDYNKLENLYNIRYSLAEYRCNYSDGRLVPMNSLLPNTTINSCPHQHLNSIIVPVVATTGVLIMIILAIIFVGIVRYKSRKPEDARRILKLFDDGKLISALMALLFENRNNHATTEFSYDVFIAYHDLDRRSLKQEIINKLVDMDVKVVTEEDIQLGSSRLEGVLESIEKCRSILLILSPDFAEDDWCRDITIRASARQHAVIPLVFVPFILDDNEVIFSSLINTCRPIYWHSEIEQQENDLKELKARIVDEIQVHIFDLL